MRSIARAGACRAAGAAIAVLVLAASPGLGAETPIPAGTDTLRTITTSGEYRLQPGKHTVTATMLLPPGVILRAEPGARLELRDAALRLQSHSTVDGLVIATSGEAGRLEVFSAPTPSFQSDIAIRNCRLSGPGQGGLYVGQGYADYHREITIDGNVFDGTTIYIEVGAKFTITRNTFLNEAGKRPLQLAGFGHIVTGNRISGGITGILFLSRYDLGGWRAPTRDNLVANNIVDGISEEAISFDLFGNDAAATSVREYDVVAEAPRGAGEVVLASPNWTDQTVYGEGPHHMAFVSGALAGKHYPIVRERGGRFTLAIPAADHAGIRPGDGAVVETIAANNVVINNTVVRSDTGILFWGWGHDGLVANNIVEATGPDGHGITFASLNAIVAAGSVTGLPRRAPSANNAARDNLVFRGRVEPDFYKNYGEGGDYRPAFVPPLNTSTADPRFVSPTRGDFGLAADSPAIDAGEPNEARRTDFHGHPIYGAPDLGAIEYQPPFRIGVDRIDPAGSIRIYGDGRYRYTAPSRGARPPAAGIDFAVAPPDGFGTFDAVSPRPAWLDISRIAWSRRGARTKQWTAAGAGARAAVYTIGDLEPGSRYDISVDGARRATLRADAEGRIVYAHSGDDAARTFRVEPSAGEPTRRRK